ncbi:hypothetical protein GCM10009646_78460 [Streptomyces aureus]
MGCHGEGEVAVPAGVAADLVVVQAAALLRGPEAFVGGPAAVGDVDQAVERGGCRVAGDLLGLADAAAGDRCMAAVFAAPGTDLHPLPVVDTRPVGAVAAGTAFLLLPGQPGEQVVREGRWP